MKPGIIIILGAAVTALLLDHATAAVILAPVGPNPSGLRNPATTGQLEVFSALKWRTEGNNPPWHQHTGYYLYNEQGRELRRVDNTVGYYAQAPRIISLPAGRYLVKARAKSIFWLKVPVVIQPGAVTKVHLDGNWKPLANTSATEVVSAPAGYPVGWRSNLASATGTN
jgi:hypothetical protein